jgi:hypothetical protein
MLVDFNSSTAKPHPPPPLFPPEFRSMLSRVLSAAVNGSEAYPFETPVKTACKSAREVQYPQKVYS